MFDFIKSFKLSDILDLLHFSSSEVRLVGVSALLITLVTSFVLTYIMMRFKGKRPVDNALVLRETAFILVILRAVLGLIFDDLNYGLWVAIIYVYLALAVGGLLYLTIREQWFTHVGSFFGNNSEFTRVNDLEECQTELNTIKEKYNGNEEV